MNSSISLSLMPGTKSQNITQEAVGKKAEHRQETRDVLSLIVPRET